MKWNQYQANPANSGFIPRRTRPAINASWMVKTGPIGYASPVIGPNGFIYVGSLDGYLYAVDSAGILRWQKKLKAGYTNSKITASCAVDKAGNIYVIDSYARWEADHRAGETERRMKIDSVLHCFDSTGNKKWQFNFPLSSDPYSSGQFTYSAPKILENDTVGPTVFFPMITTEGANTVHYLLAVDQNGNLLEQRKHSEYPPEPISGSTDWGDNWDSVWDFISSPVDFDTSGIPGDPGDREKYLQMVGKRPSPTPALFNINRADPLVIFDDSVRKLACYEWINNDLRPVWNAADQNFRYRSSPVVLPNASIVLGQADGKVIIHNVSDGKALYKPWVKAGKSIITPIASFGRQLYIIAENTFQVLDGNEPYGEAIFHGNEYALGAPALSASYCYLMTTHGLYTYSFKAEKRAQVEEFPGGVSTVAIADDGTIYAVDFQGTLWAFNTAV